MKKVTWKNEKRKLGSLTPWPRNPRQIKKDEAKRLSTSLKEFNQVETIAIGPKDEVYNGHQRLNVWLDELGPDFEVDVRVSSRKLTEKEREKLTVYLHQGATGEWDFDILANEFEIDELLDWGFSERELQIEGFEFGGNGDAPEAQIDKAEELQKKWQVERGQIWEIGRHRLMCGDSTNSDVEKLIDVEIGVIITDPPYGLGDTKSFNKDHPDYEDDEPFDLKQIDLSYPFVVMGGNYYDWLPEPRNKIGWLVWDKRPDLEGEKRKRADRRFGQHFEIGITNIGELRGKMLRYRWGGYYGDEEIQHKTQKPIELMQIFIKATKGMVLDYFLGSGTTMVAAEQLNRICYGMEIHPPYCSVTLERMSDMGLTPKLVNNG